MATQSLYRRYRPRRFSEVRGQDHIVRALRNAHAERIGPQITDATADYELKNLRPGSAEAAIGIKRDPAFPDFTAPNRIQSITIVFSTDPDPRNTERRAWQQRVKETFNFAALAALLN